MQIKPLSNHDLLVRLKYGDAAAFDRLYERYSLIFQRFAQSKGLASDEAEDVVDDIFFKIWTCISSYSEVICGGEKWMWSICRNKVTDVLRAKKKQGLELFDIYSNSEEANPAELIEQQERIQLVNQALAKLSVADREQLQRGRGRGPGRKALHEAMQRLRLLFSEES